jgi:outer membrane protein assembly factor BamB
MVVQPVKILLGLCITCAASLTCGAEEWPKWLGPNGDGISHESIAASWPADGPRKVWEQKCGVGYASPIALDGKVYLFNQVGSQDMLTAFDAESGKVLWSQGYEGMVKADPSGPQDTNPDSGFAVVLATPTIDNGKIYTYGAGGDLTCRKLSDGSEIWRINVLRELNEKILHWAQASTPLVTEKLVYVQGGQGGPTAVALDKETGKVVWKSEAHTSGGYAAPIVVDVQGTKQLVIFGNENLYGVNPQTGKTLWSIPFSNRAQVNAATPLYHDGHLFIACDYARSPSTCMMVALTPGGAKKEWESQKIMQKFQPAILDGEYLYTNSEGILKCMKWPDGNIAWENNLRLGSGGSVVRDGDKLIVMSERGKLGLVQATPQGSKVIRQVQLFDFTKTWSTPLIYRGKLYCMGENTLVCLDISGHPIASLK